MSASNFLDMTDGTPCCSQVLRMRASYLRWLRNSCRLRLLDVKSSVVGRVVGIIIP